MASKTAEKSATAAASLVERMSNRFGVDADKLLHILKATAFRQKKDQEISNEQLAALLVVAEQYNLNPFTREIYAFPDKSNGIVPVVGVDGWSRIVNENKHCDGVEFTYSDDLVTPEGAKVSCPEWIECLIYRKDRNRPTVIREYLDEVYREPFSSHNNGKPYTISGPWQSHPKRFLRHKAFIQCARIALGFTGLYDEDEANRIIDMGNVVEVSPSSSLPALEMAKIDPIVDELIKRAKAMNSWSASNQYLMQNFQGREFAYASNKLKTAEAEHLRAQDAQMRTLDPDAKEQPDFSHQNVQNEGQPPAAFEGFFEDPDPRGHGPIPDMADGDDFAFTGSGNHGDA